MRPLASVVVAVLCVSALSAQTYSRGDYISRAIDDAVTAAGLPSGYGSLVVGYRDDSVTVYKTYGQATVDGTVPLDENTLFFGLGSLTKLFTATLAGTAHNRGLPLDTPAASLLPAGLSLPSSANRYNVTLLNLADHRTPVFLRTKDTLASSVNDLYGDYVAEPNHLRRFHLRAEFTIAAAAILSTCRCSACSPPAVPGSRTLFTPAPPTFQRPAAPRWVYSNLGFEVLGNLQRLQPWLGYPDWNHANAKEITQPLGMADTVPRSNHFTTADQVARAAKQPVTLLPAQRT